MSTLRAMRTAAILPVKSFSRAKRRLGESVADELRLGLARAMVADVLDVLCSSPALQRTIVVTREPWASELAGELGATVVHDGVEEGQSAAVRLGIAHAIGSGVGRVLCVPGDCPALDPAELGALLDLTPTPEDDDEGHGDGRHGDEGHGDDRHSDGRDGNDRHGDARHKVVIVPDRHGTGTNGLLLSPPTAIEPSFGPGSCERHRALARAAGLPCRLARPSSLLLDVDTGADLAALRERLSGERFHAPRTRAVLGIDGELSWRASHSAA